MADPNNYIPHWSYIRRKNTPPITVDPMRLNMNKINQAFRKQDLQKYDCIIQDFEEFKRLAKKDYVTFFISFFSNLVSNIHLRKKIKNLFKKFNEKNGVDSFLTFLQSEFISREEKTKIINTSIFNAQVQNIPNMNNGQPVRNLVSIQNSNIETSERNTYSEISDKYISESPVPQNKQTAFYKLLQHYKLNFGNVTFFLKFVTNPEAIILYNPAKSIKLSEKLIASSFSTTPVVKKRIQNIINELVKIIKALHYHGIIIGNLECSNIRYYKIESYNFFIESFLESSYFADNSSPDFLEYNDKLFQVFSIIADILIDSIYGST